MKILIADDVKGWQYFHKCVLSRLFPDARFNFADSATEAYSKILEQTNDPYNLVITDMQMELDYHPLHAGEWLIERIQETKQCLNTKIVTISATPNLRLIAEKYSIDYIPKSAARNLSDSYDFIKEIFNKQEHQ